MVFIKQLLTIIGLCIFSFSIQAAPTLSFEYGAETEDKKPIPGVKLTQTESDGTITIYTSNAAGQVVLTTTSNTYTLTASLAETGTDPISVQDALYILQHIVELRTLTSNQIKAADINGDGNLTIQDALKVLQHNVELITLEPSLSFYDKNTGNALTETTFSSGDTPLITVIRQGDANLSFEPSSTNAQYLDWVITSKNKAYDYSQVDITFAASTTIAQVELTGDDSYTQTLAAMLITIEHYPNTADKQVLQSIIDSASATANEKIIATAIMNLEHQATTEDKNKLQAIIDDATATAAEITLATIVHAFNHYPSASDKVKLQLIDDADRLTLLSFEDNTIKLFTPIVFKDTEFDFTLTITDSANNTDTFEQTILVELYKHPLDAFKKLSTIYTENFSSEDYAVFNFSFDAKHTAELFTETVCYEGCVETDGYFTTALDSGEWGDFNGDGHEDFVAVWFVSPHAIERDGSSTLCNIEIFLNNGEGRLIRNRDIYVDGVPPSSHFLYRMAIADFNKDGIDDIFSVAMGLIQRGVDGELVKNLVYPHALLLSTPEGKFRDASSIIEGNTQAPCDPSSAACNLWAGHNSADGDINGDGYPDLSIGHKLFLNENGEKFVDVTDQLPSEWEDQNLYPGPMTTEIQDFNNDGFGDLVMFWADSAGLDDPPDPEILLSNGTATISDWTRKSLPIGYFGDGLTKFNNKFSGDIDGDGDLDMVTNTTRTNPAYYRGRYIQVLVNDGDGNFTDNSFAALGEQPRAGDYGDPDYTHFCDAHGEGSIFLRDYDGDGDLDIIDVGPGGATPTSCASPNIFLNNGTGVFSELAVDWAWAQGTQVEGWETWQDSGAARPPEGRKIKKAYPINLDNKNHLDFVSSWRAPAQDASGTSVENIVNTYQIMSKK